LASWSETVEQQAAKGSMQTRIRSFGMRWRSTADRHGAYNGRQLIRKLGGREQRWETGKTS